MKTLVIASHNNSTLSPVTLAAVSAALKIGASFDIFVAGKGCATVAEEARRAVASECVHARKVDADRVILVLARVVPTAVEGQRASCVSILALRQHARASQRGWRLASRFKKGQGLASRSSEISQ